MVEIVFGDSASGSLKVAQRFGAGPYRKGAIGVIVSHTDGSKPTEEEIDQARRKAEQEARLAWEEAVPLGGEPSDVIGFSLALSVGEIDGAPLGPKRRRALEHLLSVNPEEGKHTAGMLLKEAARRLSAVRSRALAGETLRIWYSGQPDELCGLCWMMSQLNHWGIDGPVLTVRLPEWETVRDGSLVRKNSWGDVAPEEWHRYLPLQQPVTPAMRKFLISLWRTLQEENAPLRAVLNGRLVSVPETFYDSFLCREIEAEGERFREAAVIGRVLGKYQLGIGDSWIALRIEEMLRSGALEVETEHAREEPVYHRVLRKKAWTGT